MTESSRKSKIRLTCNDRSSLSAELKIQQGTESIELRFSNTAFLKMLQSWRSQLLLPAVSSDYMYWCVNMLIYSLSNMDLLVCVPQLETFLSDVGKIEHRDKGQIRTSEDRTCYSDCQICCCKPFQTTKWLWLLHTRCWVEWLIQVLCSSGFIDQWNTNKVCLSCGIFWFKKSSLTARRSHWK